jgi:hypothetical protein
MSGKWQTQVAKPTARSRFLLSFYRKESQGEYNLFSFEATKPTDIGALRR